MGDNGTFMYRLTSYVWLSGCWSSVISAADLGGISIIVNVTPLALALSMNMRNTGPGETDWLVISSKEATDQASFFTFSYAFKMVTWDEVLTRFRLTQDKIPAYRKSYLKHKNYVKMLEVNMQHELPYPLPFP